MKVQNSFDSYRKNNIYNNYDKSIKKRKKFISQGNSLEHKNYNYKLNNMTKN